jgi:hypothetical protein
MENAPQQAVRDPGPSARYITPYDSLSQIDPYGHVAARNERQETSLQQSPTHIGYVQSELYPSSQQLHSVSHPFSLGHLGIALMDSPCLYPYQAQYPGVFVASNPVPAASMRNHTYNQDFTGHQQPDSSYMVQSSQYTSGGLAYPGVKQNLQYQFGGSFFEDSQSPIQQPSGWSGSTNSSRLGELKKAAFISIAEGIGYFVLIGF